MNASVSFGLGLASLLLAACSAGSGNPTGGDILGDNKQGPRAEGSFWAVSKADTWTKRPPLAVQFDLGGKDSLKSVALPREPLEAALTSAYLFVNCKGGLLVRIDRTSLAIDSLAVGKKLSLTDAEQFKLAADDNAVWMAHAKEGVVRVDPKTLAETNRGAFRNGANEVVDGIALSGGAPWLLIAGWDFRLQRVDPAAFKLDTPIALSRNRLDPKAPSQGGKGRLAVSGSKALVLDLGSKGFIRVDLAAAKVETFWDTDWFGPVSWSVATGELHGHDAGFVVTHTNEKWVRTLGLSGKDHKEFTVPWGISAQGVRARDGLFAMGYRTIVDGGEVGLYRPATHDTATSVFEAHKAVDIVFE